MLIIFPAEPGQARKVDQAFDREYRAAVGAGLDVGLVGLDDSTPYTGQMPQGDGAMAIYRGWMLSAFKYAGLYNKVWGRGYHLINSPDEYRYCHELPKWYPDFENATLVILGLLILVGLWLIFSTIGDLVPVVFRG